MSQSPDVMAAAFKMVLSLAAVLAILWMLHRWIKRAQPVGGAMSRGRLIQILSSHHLGMKKSIALVKVPGTLLVLGIGADQVNLLTRIDDPAVIASVGQAFESNAESGFREQLQRMIRPLAQRADRADMRKSSDEAI